MLYVIGGVSDGTQVTDVNRYNATTNAWTPLAPIPVASEAPCGAHWNGKIYVAQGDTGNSLRIYDIATDSWTLGAPRPVASGYGCAAGALNNKVYVIGGDARPADAADGLRHRNQQLVDGESGARRRLPLRLPDGRQLPVHRRWLRGQLRCQLDRDHRLDMSTGVWSSGPAFTPQRADFALASSGTKLYAIGGDLTGNSYFESTNLVNELDTASWPSRSWVASPPNLPSPVRQRTRPASIDRPCRRRDLVDGRAQRAVVPVPVRSSLSIRGSAATTTASTTTTTTTSTSATASATATSASTTATTATATTATATTATTTTASATTTGALPCAEGDRTEARQRQRRGSAGHAAPWVASAALARGESA